MDLAELPHTPDESRTEPALRPDPRTRGLRRLAFSQTVRDPAAAIFVACALPAMLVLPATPLIFLAAPAFLAALWKVKYLELLDAPPSGLCSRCLYDTRGITSPICPECGQTLLSPSTGVRA